MTQNQVRPMDKIEMTRNEQASQPESTKVRIVLFGSEISIRTSTKS